MAGEQLRTPAAAGPAPGMPASEYQPAGRHGRDPAGPGGGPGDARGWQSPARLPRPAQEVAQLPATGPWGPVRAVLRREPGAGQVAGVPVCQASTPQSAGVGTQRLALLRGGPAGRQPMRRVCARLLVACTVRGPRAAPGRHRVRAGPAGACRRLQPGSRFARVQVRPRGFARCGHGAGGRRGAPAWPGCMRCLASQKARYLAGFAGLARRCRGGWLPNWLPSAVNCRERRRTAADGSAGQRCLC